MSDDAAGGADPEQPSGLTTPLLSDIPTPATVCDESDATGYVVWHRKHLRVEDHEALATAVADGDVICPLFVFDPAFYSEDGLACDARIRFLHEAATSLDRLYATTPANQAVTTASDSIDELVETGPVVPAQPDRTTAADAQPDTLVPPESVGMTFGYGDPVTLVERFVDRGWSVVTMATPTSRYGQRRDERAKEACGDALDFVSGDGLIRDQEWTRTNWQDHAESWLTAEQQTPAWDDHEPTRLAIDTGVTPALVDDGFDITPTKRKVPTGTHRAAMTQLREFTDSIRSYPGNISAPQDARDGTSGLSPYLNFGLLSVRQVYQYVADNAPSCRGREMFTSRLYWNMHYNQKLADWPGWTDQAVNPVLAGLNEDNRDPDLVEAWKEGETGFPMVDASMRCLRETGWLNFRMRAMCASFFTHILRQPWWIGADWYHHHLVDSDVGINYTQWQSQAGLIGKPSQRVYNPRKQVRDHDPDGEWIGRWVPELRDLPSQYLDRPERTPLGVQEECGVVIGEDYPLPVVDFEARREAYWNRFERLRPRAAQMLARPEIAKRASFSGGYGAAQAIADKYGRSDDTADDGRQLSLADVDSGAGDARTDTVPGDEAESNSTGDPPREDQPADDSDTPVPTGVGERAGAPSPDDRSAVADHSDDTDRDDDDTETGPDTGQTTIGRFD